MPKPEKGTLTLEHAEPNISFALDMKAAQGQRSDPQVA